MAGLARDRDRERNRADDAARRLLEIDRHLGEDVRTACSAARGASAHAEELVAEEDGKEVGDVREVEVGRPEAAGAKALVPEAVVELARLRLREDLVRLGRLAEALLGVWLLREEAGAHEVEERDALLEHFEQALVAAEIVGPKLVEDARRPPDVHLLLAGLEDIAEGGTELREERTLAGREPWILEAAAEETGAELEARHAVVQVRAGPVGEPGVDGLGEAEQPLRHADRRRDDDHEHELRLEQDDLD